MRVILLVSLLALSASAQGMNPPALPLTGFEHDLQSWSLLTVWGKHDRFRWYAEAQPRVSFNHGFERLLLRPAVGVQVTPEISLWIGYAWTPTFTPYRDEQRPFQQVLVENKWGVVSLVNRFRVEERFIGGTTGASIRLRHMVRAVIRFGESSPWGVALYDELFLTLNAQAGGPVQGFDQNRAFAGVNLKVDAWQFELGYMNNVVHRAAPINDRMLHNLTAMIVYNVP
ncbi:MAG: DUF2490 domain-containing protein [Myxococcaceae bacterium]|nr:DUF2490 domain-containing protein [Myxococcaceae bacterium]